MFGTVVRRVLASRRAGFFVNFIAVIGLAALPGCDTLESLNPFGGGGGDEVKLEGERISVLSLEQELEVDPRLSTFEVVLPPPYVNDAWPQPGGYASHAMHHLQVPDEIDRTWRVKAGRGTDGDVRLTAPPVAADGKVFVRDAVASVAAFDLTTGDKLWDVDLKPEKTKSRLGTGGGVAYDKGRVFASTGFGFIVSLDAASGGELWRQPLGLAIHSAPTVSDGRVFVSTVDNQLFALDDEDGRILWNHRGITETARLFPGSSPAVAGDIVIAPYSSGEVFALRTQNGRVAWSDTLVRTGRLTSLSALNDIVGRPVVDRGRVYAISHSGRMVAIDLRTGERVWTRNLGGVQTPWVAGDFIYVVSLDGEVVCLFRSNGAVRWITPLQQFKNQEKKKDPIQWSGPVLAGDRLIVVSSTGKAVSISPYTGDVLGQIEMPDGSFIPPVVVDQAVLLLTNKAELIAYK